MSTLRQAMKELLAEQPRSSLELSQLLSQSEKEVLDHLSHLARAPGPGRRFQIIPAVCKNCGFVFRKRDRLTRPSRCPLCQHQSISRPRFALVEEVNVGEGQGVFRSLLPSPHTPYQPCTGIGGGGLGEGVRAFSP